MEGNNGSNWTNIIFNANQRNKKHNFYWIIHCRKKVWGIWKILPHNQTHELHCFGCMSNPLNAAGLTETWHNEVRYRCHSLVLSPLSRSSSPPTLCHCLNSWCRSDLSPFLSSLDGARQHDWRRPPWRLWVTRRMSPHFLPRKLGRRRGFLLLPSGRERESKRGERRKDEFTAGVIRSLCVVVLRKLLTAEC